MKLLSRPLLVTMLLLGAAFAAACQAPVAPTKEPPRATVVIPVSAPGKASVQDAWQSSAHATSFVEGDNNGCARCHAPMSWTPTDPADMPATCASCKFTIKTPPPLTKADWPGVSCDVCHEVENKVLTTRVAWLNAAIAQFDSSQSSYSPVATTGELCRKCHADSSAGRYGRDMGSTAHAAFACDKCHDSHSLKASCTAAGCHPSVLKPAVPIPGHDADHAKVTCAACHDASGLKAGRLPDGTSWVVFRPADARGKTVATPYASHALQRKADCARCHYAGNAWGLKTY